MHVSKLHRQLGADRGGPKPREVRPFEHRSLALRLAPFLGLSMATLTIVPFAYGGMTYELTVAWATIAVIAGSAFLVPWGRLPAYWQVVPPLLFYVIAALVRDATGGHESIFSGLVLLPVVWFVLYGTLRQVLASSVGCALAIGLAPLLDGGEKYPAAELGRAALDALMTGGLGVVGLHLMQRFREGEALSRSILDSADEAFISIDQDGCVVEWNPQAERDFGWSRKEALGRPVVELTLPDEDREHYMPALERLLSGDERVVGRRIEVTAARRDGSRFPVELSFSSVATSHGLRFNAFLHDVSGRRTSEEALRLANQRFRSAFDDAAVGMAITSPDGRYLRVNGALAELVGYSQDQLLRMSFADITHPDDLSKDLAALSEMLAGNRDRYQTEKRYLHADGHLIWVSLSTSVVRDSEDRPMYVLAQMQDVSERKETEARLTHRASHDALTGLPNRSLLEDRMVLGLGRQRRERRPMAVIYLDLDGFKKVNDTFGHDAGDYLLVATAKRLTALLRPTDVVSRLGGDEFAILCENMDEHGATRLAKRIRDAVPAPLQVEGGTVTVTPSVGIAVNRDPGTLPSDLLADADMAMYFAKEQGDAGYAHYEDELRQRAQARLAVDAGLNG